MRKLLRIAASLLLCAAVILAAWPPQAKAADFSTSAIQAVCNKYGFSTGKYWTYNTKTGNAAAYTASTHGCNEANYEGYKYPKPQKNGDWYGSQCWGFADLIGAELTGVIPSLNWTRYTSIEAAGGLKVGDILRAGGHSAMIYSINFSTGDFTVAECWGGGNNYINVGGHWQLHHVTGPTVELVMENYAFEFICRAPGNSNPTYVPKALSVDTLTISNVSYPSTYKIDPAHGYYMKSGRVLSDCKITNVTIDIQNANGVSVSGHPRSYAPNAKSFSIVAKDSEIYFSRITEPGKYSFIISAADEKGRTARLAMPVNAVTTGSGEDGKGNTESEKPLSLALYRDAGYSEQATRLELPEGQTLNLQALYARLVPDGAQLGAAAGSKFAWQAANWNASENDAKYPIVKIENGVMQGLGGGMARLNVTYDGKNKLDNAITVVVNPRVTDALKDGTALAGKDLNMYSYPWNESNGSTVLSTMAAGSVYRITGETVNRFGNTWYRVSLDGKNYWVYSGAVSVTDVPVTPAPAPTAAPNPPPASKRLPGDVNGDGSVDDFDVIRLLKYVSGWDVTIVAENADVNGDGSVDDFDVIRLLKYVSGWGVSLN